MDERADCSSEFDQVRDERDSELENVSGGTTGLDIVDGLLQTDALANSAGLTESDEAGRDDNGMDDKAMLGVAGREEEDEDERREEVGTVSFEVPTNRSTFCEAIRGKDEDRAYMDC